MRYISIDEAEPGMLLGKAVYDSFSRILVAKGRPLSADYIHKLKVRGYLGFYIEDEFSDGIEVKEAISPELRNRGVEALRKKNIDATLQVAKDIVGQILHSDTISLDMVDLRTFDDYTYRHSVNVAVLSTIIGMGMGLQQDELNDVCIAAMFHDMGKLMIDAEIINKPGRLTKDEFRLIKMHPQLSLELLTNRWNVSIEAKEAILCHHENDDGSGYPRGLRKNEIPLYAKIIHVADVYDALTSKRAYKDPYTPSESIEYLMGGCHILFDEKVVKAFLKWVPVYPKGVVVKLSDGRDAIVCENTKNPIRPKVRLRSGEVLDLGDEKKNLDVTINPTSSVETDFSNEMAAIGTDENDKRPVILVVDDTVLTLQMVRSICEKQFRVIMAKNSKDALHYIQKNGMPALILMDVLLPDVGGIETAKIVRELYGKEVPILFLTALSDRETVQQCRAVGANDYIVKPFRPTYLLERINVALGLNRYD